MLYASIAWKPLAAPGFAEVLLRCPHIARARMQTHSVVVWMESRACVHAFCLCVITQQTKEETFTHSLVPDWAHGAGQGSTRTMCFVTLQQWSRKAGFEPRRQSDKKPCIVFLALRMARRAADVRAAIQSGALEDGVCELPKHARCTGEGEAGVFAGHCMQTRAGRNQQRESSVLNSASPCSTCSCT